MVCEDLLGGNPTCELSGGNSCEQCIVLACCARLATCPSYNACVCILTCTGTGAAPAACEQSCGETGQGCDLANCGDACVGLCPA